MKLILDLLSSYNPDNPNFRPTEIYNENWLLKVVLSQVEVFGKQPSLITFNPGSIWFSEAQLPTAFKARYQGDRLAESRTNADAVIGHFSIGKHGKADLELKSHCSQLTVIEAKLRSSLSPGTRNAPYFNQVARNIACMAELFHRANLQPSNLERVEFILVAPLSAIENGVFTKQMKLENIRSVVQQRVFEYDGELDQWYSDWFIPTANVIQIQTIRWEDIIEHLLTIIPPMGQDLGEFYKLCLKFN